MNLGINKKVTVKNKNNFLQAEACSNSDSNILVENETVENVNGYLRDEEALNAEYYEKEIIKIIKQKVKNDDNFINLVSNNSNSFTNFGTQLYINNESFKEKLYCLIVNVVEQNFPLIDFKITESFLDKVYSEIFGLGILEKYLFDKSVTDIFIQNTEMLIIKDGVKQYLGEVFNSIDDLNVIVERIKISSGKTFDQRIPFLNARLFDGSRCSIVIPPISDKIYITIRVFNCIDFELEDLLRHEMFSARELDLLKDFVRHNKNILIAGSTGSGKTTLLNTLAKLIPKSEIINLIQDLPEIKLPSHPFVRILTTRAKTREIDNEINQDRLVFETLRMKADRIILGEVRDCMAAYQLLQALNTGHRGSFSTIHSDSAYDALLRLEMLAMEYKENLNIKAVKKIIARAIDVVIFLEIQKDEKLNIVKRKIKEIILVDNELNSEGDYKLNYLL